LLSPTAREAGKPTINTAKVRQRDKAAGFKTMPMVVSDLCIGPCVARMKSYSPYGKL